jgi:hypothetical protein
MATILSQLAQLRNKIKIPYVIQFVDKEINPEEFEEKVIYIHITI